MPSPPCTEKQAKFLKKLGGDPDGLNVSQAAAEIDRLLGKEPQQRQTSARSGGYKGQKIGPGPISEGQKKVLEKYGVNTKGMTKVQASAKIDQIRDNGWKLPEFDDEPEGVESDGIPFGN